MPVADEHCSSYDTKEYTAQLHVLEAPPHYNPMIGCEEMPIEINGKTFYSPGYCESRVRVDKIRLPTVLPLTVLNSLRAYLAIGK